MYTNKTFFFFKLVVHKSHKLVLIMMKMTPYGSENKNFVADLKILVVWVLHIFYNLIKVFQLCDARDKFLHTRLMLT